MMKGSRGTDELIAKYLLGIISEPENETLNQWIQASPPHEVVFHRLLTTSLIQNGTLTYPVSPVKNKKQESEQPKSNMLATRQTNKFRITFKDAPTVHLNYNTELRYPIKFGRPQHIVSLRNEAHFTVSKETSVDTIII